MNPHAILAASAAHIWTVCAPAARFGEQLPDEESEYAKEGDLAHELAALVLSTRSGIFVGNKGKFNAQLQKIQDEVITFYTDLKHDDPTAEYFNMLEYAEGWASLVMDYVINYSATLHIEKRYHFDPYIPYSYGTADASGSNENILFIGDYKFGAGVRVNAKNNKQLMCYALGALLEAVKKGNKGIETVVMFIHQPRAGGTSTWEISTDDLMKWAESIEAIAKQALHGQGEFVPGKHCQFCDARTVCKAYYDKFEILLNIKDNRVMTDEDLDNVLRYGSLVKSWINKIEEKAVKDLEARKKITGYKLVAGKPRRSFKNEDEVIDILLGLNWESDEIFTPTLRALTDIEKKVGPKRFTEYFVNAIVNIEGRPQIAPIDDDRPAIDASAADEYDDYEDLT